MVRDMSVQFNNCKIGEVAGKISVYCPDDNWIKLFKVIPLDRPLPEQQIGGQQTIHCRYINEDNETDTYESNEYGECYIHDTYVEAIVRLNEDGTDEFRLDANTIMNIIVTCSDQELIKEVSSLREEHNRIQEASKWMMFYPA